MKLILQYDPWKDRVAAVRAADALNTLGIPVELVEARPTRTAAGVAGPIVFEPITPAADSAGEPGKAL
jgi:hypothetical protein